MNGDVTEKHSPFKFEFWSAWLIYFPVFFYYLFLSLRARSLSYMTASNPLMYMGGFVEESKIEILKKIPAAFKPKEVFVSAVDPIATMRKQMDDRLLTFPVVIKPEVGERGNDVEKVENGQALENYFQHKVGKFIIQEWIDSPLELGVLYYRLPDGSKSGITSIVMKSFLSVTGNGVDTLEALIRKAPRASTRLEYLLKKFDSQLNDVIPEGMQIELEPIGNHCRGTKFLNGNQLINQQLVKVFDEIASSIDGFYIGRFDIKVESLDLMYEGKGIKILELNGATSEPAHIYDPSTSLREAYSALFEHQRILFQIAVMNHKRGIAYAGIVPLFTEILKHSKK